MRKVAGRIACVVLLMPVWLMSAYGATLSGTVTEEGEPIAEAEVKLVDAGNRVVVRNVSTDAQGSFRFNVKPGLYDILIFKSQYANTWAKGIRVGEANVYQSVELTPKAFVESEDAASADDCDP